MTKTNRAYGRVSTYRLALTLLSLTALAVIVLVGIRVYRAREVESDRERAVTRIPVSEVGLVQYPSEYTNIPTLIRGRVRNGSTRFELSAIEVEVTVRDCVGEECELLGRIVSRLKLGIPPGDSREFEALVSLRPALSDPAGVLDWEIRLTQTWSNTGLSHRPCDDGDWYGPG